jgi:hypothetical protein
MAHYRHSIKSWSDAKRVWTEHEQYLASIGRHGVRLGYCTYLVDTGDRVMMRPSMNVQVEEPVLAVRHHATDIVVFWPHGRIKIETDGWITVTTLERLQEFTPANIHVYGEHVQSKRKPGYFHIEEGETPIMTLDEKDVTGGWL